MSVNICFQEFYPENHLRNVALRRVNTEYVFLLDIDILPMPNFYRNSRSLLESASAIAIKLGIDKENKLVCITFACRFAYCYKTINTHCVLENVDNFELM